MAIAPLIVAVRTTGAAQLTALGNSFRRLAANARVSTNRMTNNLIARGGLMNTALGRMTTSVVRAGHNMTQALGQAGRQGLQALSNSLENVPMLKAIGATIGAILSPAIGAALNAGILAVVGGGVLAGGIALALKNSNVAKKAFTDVFRPIAEDTSNWALMFEGPLVSAAQVFGNAWKDNGDVVRRMFSSLTDTVEPLARGISGLVENALPGIEKAVAASGPVLKELAATLPGLGSAISDFFDSIASGGDGAVRALRYLVIWLSGTISAVGQAVEVFSKMFKGITDEAERFVQFLANLPVIGGMFEGLANKLGVLNGSVEGSARAMEGASTASAGTATSLDRQAQAAERAGAAAFALSQKLGLLVGSQLSADQAALQWEITIDALTESLRQNGATLDANTAKGQANVGALLSGVQAALAKRDADIELAGGEKASAGAVDAANAAFRRQIDQLASVLRQAGATEAQIQALLGKYYALVNAPNVNKSINVTTYYRTVGDARAAGATGNLAPRPGGRGPVGFAAGTPKAPTGWAWVGEDGPELVNFGGGEQVLDSRASRRMAAGGGYSGGGTSVMVSAPARANRTLVDAVLKELQIRVRTQGRGSVQTLLGSSGRL